MPLLLAFIVACFALIPITPRAYGNPLSPSEAVLSLQGPAPDADFGLLTKFVGVQPGASLNYSFDTNADFSGWSGLLSGSYLGKNINVDYTGSLSQGTAATRASWSSSGLYGEDQWIGKGNAVFTDTANGFQIGFSSFLRVGGNAAQVGSPESPVTIIAADNGSNITFIQTLASAIGFGCCIDFSFDSPNSFSNLTFSTIHTDLTLGDPGLPDATPLILRDVSVIFIDATGIHGNGTINVESVPEPPSILLLSAGVLAMISFQLARRY
jgi:hypothetical protein